MSTQDVAALRPLRLGSAIGAFGLSAVPFWLGLYVALPLLVRTTGSASLSLSVGFLVPLALLLVAALVVAQRERTAPGVGGLLQRLRLGRPLARHGLWAAALLAVTLLGYFSLGGTAQWLQEHGGLAPPAAFELVRTETTFWGIPLAGNWWAVVLHLGILLLNVLGEELWFRGVLFPRQLAAHGPRAWLVHGLCYHMFHMFYPWDVLRLLPESLAYGWVTQRSGSTWPAIFAHLAFNGLGLLGTVSAVLAA